MDFFEDKKMEDTFNDPDFSDFEVHVGGKVFRVSKYLLCLHSDVFRACFRSETVEKKSGIIKIKDLDPNLVESMLKFMYNIKIENIKEIAHDLFVVAEKYNVRKLMKRCLDSMIANINRETLHRCIDLSFQMHVPKLQQKTVKFIVDQLRKGENTEELKDLFNQNVEIPWKVIQELLNGQKEVLKNRRGFPLNDGSGPSSASRQYDYMHQAVNPTRRILNYESESSDDSSDGDEDAIRRDVRDAAANDRGLVHDRFRDDAIRQLRDLFDGVGREAEGREARQVEARRLEAREAWEAEARQIREAREAEAREEERRRGNFFRRGRDPRIGGPMNQFLQQARDLGNDADVGIGGERARHPEDHQNQRANWGRGRGRPS